MESKFAFAKEIIKEAAAYIKENISQSLTIEQKTSHNDLVTNIDKQTQDLLVQRIQERYKNDHIFAEENGLVHDIKDGAVWVLDPIDGTVNFIAQQEDFCIMIAYYDNGVGQFGLIYDVMADKLYHGGGTFDVYCNGTKLPVYQGKPIELSLIASNAAMYAANYQGVRHLVDKSLGVRVYGGAGLSMAKVLTGQIMAYFSAIYPWDYAAASIMGERLGYELVTLTGEPIDYHSRQAVMLIPKLEKDKIKAIMAQD